MKKVLAILLAMTLCMALGVAAFAAGNTTTITAPDNDRTYEVYQILVGDLSEGGTLTNFQWGENATKSGAVSADGMAKLSAEKTSDANTTAEIAKFVDFSEAGFGTISHGSKLTVPTGYYLVKDLGVKGADGSYSLPDGAAYSLYVIEVVGPTTITPKDSAPIVEKEIVEGTAKVKKNNASVGDTVSYEITGTVPGKIADYATYYYEFNDTLSKGLTYDGNLVIKVDGADKTASFTTTVTENADGTTTIKISTKDLKAVAAITADTKVVVTYDATLNEKAIINGENPNKVELVYSNDPNHSGASEENTPKGKTPEDKVITFVSELTILKTDENNNVLTGAAFKLEGEGVVKTKVTGSKFEKTPYTADEGETIQDGTYYLLKNGKYTKTVPTDDIADKYDSTTETYVCVDFEQWVKKTADIGVEAYVDENGELVFTGIGAGTYTLTETATPDGYNSIQPVTITVKFDGENFYIDEAAEKDDSGKVVAESMTMSYNVVNKSGANLPSTGGVGTKLFYVVGSALMVSAIVVLVAKKRMGAGN